MVEWEALPLMTMHRNLRDMHVRGEEEQESGLLCLVSFSESMGNYRERDF